MSEPTYKIKLIITQYEERYPGQYMPNVVDAWDEYSMEENTGGYYEALDKARKEHGVDAIRELEIELPQSAILNLYKTPTVKAEVVE